MKRSIVFVVIRYVLILTVGYLFKFLIIDRIVPYDNIFNYAFFTLLILPVPFSLSIIVGRYSSKENSELINNTIVLNTFVCIILYIIFVSIIGVY